METAIFVATGCEFSDTITKREIYLADPKNSQAALKLASATLTARIVQTLNETNPSFHERFLKRLHHAGAVHRESDRDHHQDLFEVLGWTQELLTGWSDVSGQGKPFLGG